LNYLVVFVALYLGLNILVGWWASRRVTTTEDFVLAGRGLGFVLATMVTFATWFGSETMMGAPAEFVRDGVLGVIEEPLGASMCLILVGVFYARTFYRWNIITFCDFFKARYGQSAELLSALLIVPSYFGWIAAQLVALGVVMKAILGVEIQTGIYLSASIVTVYTIMGGMWSVSITDFLHNLLLIIGLTVLGIVLYQEIGGWNTIVARTPPDFFRFTPKTHTFQTWASYIAAWITVGLGSIPQQDIFQRVMASRSENVAVRSAITAGFLYLTIAAMPLIIALMATFLHPDLLKGDPKMIIPNMVLAHTSPLIQILFFGALVSAILSTTSGAVLAPAAVIGENLVKPYVKNLTDKQLLSVIRGAVLAVMLVCVYMAVVRQDIFNLVGESSAFSLVSLFVPLTAGLVWQRANLWGCLASMALGWGVWMYCYLIETQIPSILYGLLASLLSMVIGSLLTPSKQNPSIG
jgi:solute:Na+ symporter, SSS family